MQGGGVMNDRTVHATGGDLEVDVVRYDKAGKWYIEPWGWVKGGPLHRSHVTVHEAVVAAFWYWYNTGGSPQFDRPGGLRFDSLLRAKVSAFNDLIVSQSRSTPLR